MRLDLGEDLLVMESFEFCVVELWLVSGTMVQSGSSEARWRESGGVIVMGIEWFVIQKAWDVMAEGSIAAR